MVLKVDHGVLLFGLRLRVRPPHVALFLGKSGYVVLGEGDGKIEGDGKTMGTALKLDRQRAEGVYAKLEPYPPTDPAVNLVTIERVCGDCTVLSLTIAPSEARSLLEQLKSMVRESSI